LFKRSSGSGNRRGSGSIDKQPDITPKFKVVLPPRCFEGQFLKVTVPVGLPNAGAIQSFVVPRGVRPGQVVLVPIPSLKQQQMWLRSQSQLLPPGPLYQSVVSGGDLESAVNALCYDDTGGKAGGRWKLGKRLGKGSFGSVYEGSRNGKDYALKIIPKTHAQAEKHLRAVFREIVILKTLGKLKPHPFIYRLFGAYDHGDCYYLVTELCKGGTVLDWLTSCPRRSEADVRRITSEACSALAHAHAQGIVHRDVKPENMMMTSDRNDAQLKLGDWGIAVAKRLIPLDQFCGTPQYMAPEIIESEGYAQKVDVWAMGVVLYFLLAGFHPFTAPLNVFENPSITQLFVDMLRGGLSEHHFVDATFQHASGRVRDLMMRMCVDKQENRLSMPSVLRHAWFTNPKALPTTPLPAQTLSRLRSWNRALKNM